MRPILATPAALLAVIALAAPSVAQGVPGSADPFALPAAEPPRALAARHAQVDPEAARALARQRATSEKLRAQGQAARRPTQPREFVNWPEATEMFSRTLRL